MLVVESVWQKHDKQDELKGLFEYFRFVVNEVIFLANKHKLTSLKEISAAFYKKYRDQDYYAKYTINAIRYAISKLKLYKTIRKEKPHARLPYVWKGDITVDAQSYKITPDGYFDFPIKAGHRLQIKLDRHTLEKINKSDKLGDARITPEKLIIPHKKSVIQQTPKHWVGIDRNLDNATGFDTLGKFHIWDLSKANLIREHCRTKRSKFTRNDVRIRRRISSKYGKLERDAVAPIMHKRANQIVSLGMGIILEDIKGIHKMYRRGSGHGPKYRGRMKTWSYYELQRLIEYKARRVGLPVKYVKAHGTSSKCSECGKKLIPEEDRMMFCVPCNAHVDRDINASKNILAKGLNFGPDGVTGEAMVGEPVKAIPKVDVTQHSDRTG